MTDSTTTASTPDDGLAWLEDQLAESVPQPTVTIAVKHRKGTAVQYRTDISHDEIAEWRKAATADGDVDLATMNRLILANTCLRFLKKDEAGQYQPVMSGGQPVTFGAIARRDGGTVADAVKTWLVTEGAVDSTSDRVFYDAGYVGMAEAEPDPTQG